MLSFDFPEELIVAIYKRIGSSYAIKPFQKMSLINYQWYRISKDRTLSVYCVCYKECNDDHVGCTIYKNHDYTKQLNDASKNGHLKIIKYLYESGTNLHVHNVKALKLASQNGHIELVKYLCESCANIHTEIDYALRLA